MQQLSKYLNRRKKLNISANLYRTNTAKWAGLIRVHSSVVDQSVSFLQESSLSPSPRVLDQRPQFGARLPVFFGEIFSETYEHLAADFRISRPLPDLISNSSHSELDYDSPRCVVWSSSASLSFQAVDSIHSLPQTIHRQWYNSCKYLNDNFSHIFSILFWETCQPQIPP